MRLISIEPLLKLLLGSRLCRSLKRTRFWYRYIWAHALLAFLALLKYYKPFAVGFADGVILTIAGVIISPEEIISYIEKFITIPPGVEGYLNYLFWGISLAGTAMLIASLIY